MYLYLLRSRRNIEVEHCAIEHFVHGLGLEERDRMPGLEDAAEGYGTDLADYTGGFGSGGVEVVEVGVWFRLDLDGGVTSGREGGLEWVFGSEREGFCADPCD